MQGYVQDVCSSSLAQLLIVYCYWQIIHNAIQKFGVSKSFFFLLIILFSKDALN